MPNWMCRAAIGLILLPAALIAQSQQDRPTFRSEVRYIEVDVLVTDKNGNAVRGLTKEDFTLLEDGHPQAITNFSFIDLPIEPPASRVAAAKAVESDIATNTGEGRMYVLLLNRGGQRARLVARRFVEEVVGPNDQMAVIHVLGNMSAGQGFTKSRSRMLAAIDRIVLDSGEDMVMGDRTLISFQVLEEVAERLGLISGRRKVVLWFDPPSVFLPTHPRAAVHRFAQRDAVRAATRNNVAIYPVSTFGLTTSLGLSSLEGKAGLQVLSDDTGGDVIVDSNNFTAGYQRFLKDNSTYYLLGYVPAVEHRDGKFHPLTVRLNRPGLTVRARRGYYAPEPDAESKPGPEVVEGLSADTAEALRMPSSVGDLGIDLHAAPFKGADGKGSVLLGAQLRGADLALGAGERIEIAFQAMTSEGKITQGAFHVLTLDFTSESREAILQTGVRVVDRIELPRGRHQVRFAVHQPNGKTGSVVADVEIPDYGDPLVMSGVVIGSEAAASQRTLLSDARVKNLLSSDPTALRRFARRDVITVFGEVYTDPRRQEIARVTTRLAAANGRRAPTPDVSLMPGDQGRVAYTTRIRLADLSPGDYVLTLDARTPRHMAARQVPFVVLAD